MSRKIKEKVDNDIITHYPERKVWVIKPKDFEDRYPVFCPVCEKSMNARIDEIYYKEFSCCSDCGMKWAEPNREKWSDGWRPTKQQVKEEIKNRR